MFNTSAFITASSVAFAAGALAWAAASDVRRYLIPNTTTAIVAGAYGFVALTQPLSFFLGGLLTGLGVLAVGAFFFARNWMGGGDVKLLAAMALWAGPALLSPFAFVTCLSGAALGLLMMTPLRRLMPRAPADALAGATNNGLRQPMPFGVAIALGGAYVLALHLPLVR